MNNAENDRIEQLLHHALPPVASNPEPSRNLWPAVLRRLDSEPASSFALPNAVPWFDWVLIGGLAVFAMSFPVTIPVFLYYL